MDEKVWTLEWMHFGWYMEYVNVYGKIFNMNLITASHHHTQISGFVVMVFFYDIIRKL